MEKSILPKRSHPLVIRFFDVGHGEAVLVQFPDRKTLGIIDCHLHLESNRISARQISGKEEPKLLSYLRQLRARSPKTEYRVAFICLSHFHDDHFSGMEQLIAGLRELKIPIEEFWDAGVSPKKVAALAKEGTREAKHQVKQLESLYRELRIELANGLKKEFLTSARPNFKQYGDVTLELLAPHFQHWEDYLQFLQSPNKAAHAKRNPLSADENAISSVILFKYGQATALLTGDIPNEGWQVLFADKRKKLARLHVVKSSHHGSRQGNFMPKKQGSVWKRMTERGKTVAVVSGGYRSALPHADTINAITQVGANLYCTGDYRQRLDFDPIDQSALPRKVVEALKDESVPTLDLNKPLHGDVTAFLFPDGKTNVTTEFKP